MLKRWRWLALASLALAACSSGTAEPGSPTNTIVESATPAVPDPTSSISSATSTSAAPASPVTTIPVLQSAEYVTPSGRLQMKITYDPSASSDDRVILEAYSRFLRAADLSADQNNWADPEIAATTVDPVRAKKIDSLQRHERTGQHLMGRTEHIISVAQWLSDKVIVRDCLLDGVALVTFDGSVVTPATNYHQPATAYMVQDGGNWKVRSFTSDGGATCDG